MTASTKPSKPFLLGVAGGSGSGKTYFARELARQLGDAVCAIVYQDSFYIDQSKKFDHDGGSVNFDHPSSLDFALMAECLKRLKAGQNAEVPIYDFASHRRQSKTLTIQAKSVIVVDGVLIFHSPNVRSLFDETIFFDTPEDLRYRRRLERDVNERGRTPEGVHRQFYAQVKPMHDQFVEPSRAFARTVVSNEAEYRATLARYHLPFRITAHQIPWHFISRFFGRKS